MVVVGDSLTDGRGSRVDHQRERPMAGSAGLSGVAVLNQAASTTSAPRPRHRKRDGRWLPT
ncbi:hypothetical protein AVL48_27405 [Amycolatopsis regifaucium]|uniref:Uncharacterized protein n=1 Tax=Amycolatopsis regifaucium TaxID=546365 RepID=A0A154MNR0_9PSEU|nr:hypothetical protein AVL48_27405 [Amycolatopsis regifaucium]